MTVTTKNVARRTPDSEGDEFLPFTRPSVDADDIAEVVNVLKSGWITSGAKVKALEESIAAVTQSENAVAVTSATAGLHLVLHALGIGPDDEVITPSLTWVSTINLITLCGATPVFVDVDRDTVMTDADRVQAAITAKTKLIIPVHYAGAPLDLDPLRRVASDHNIALVEDSAHALGAEYRGEPVGCSGTGIFSLQAIKNVTTAEGGVICTDDAELAERLRRLRFHGLGADAFDRETKGRMPSAEVLEPGYKYNLPDMNACLGLGQLRRLKELNCRRAELAAMYLRGFDGLDGVRPLALPAYPHTHAWHLFVIRVETDKLNIDRDAFMEQLRSRQIGTGLHFRAAHSQKYYRDNLPDDLPPLDNTNWNSDRLITLPLFPAMQDSDVKRVIDCVGEIVEGSAK